MTDRDYPFYNHTDTFLSATWSSNTSASSFVKPWLTVARKRMSAQASGRLTCSAWMKTWSSMLRRRAISGASSHNIGPQFWEGHA